MAGCLAGHPPITTSPQAATPAISLRLTRTTWAKRLTQQEALIADKSIWTDAPAGQYASTAAYYNNYRAQRQPSENLNFGRNFRMGKEGKMNLNVRAEFQNVFNRHFYSQPSLGNSNDRRSQQQSGRHPVIWLRLRGYLKRGWCPPENGYDGSPFYVLRKENRLVNEPAFHDMMEGRFLFLGMLKRLPAYSTLSCTQNGRRARSFVFPLSHSWALTSAFNR